MKECLKLPKEFRCILEDCEQCPIGKKYVILAVPKEVA